MGMQASSVFTSSVRPPEPLLPDSDTYWCQSWPKADWHLQTHFSDLGRGGLTKALSVCNSSFPTFFQLCQHIPSTLTPTRLLEGANGTSDAATLPGDMGRTRQGQCCSFRLPKDHENCGGYSHPLKQGSLYSSVSSRGVSREVLQQLLNPERHLLSLLAHMGLVAQEGLVNPGIVILVWAVKKGVGIRQRHICLCPLAVALAPVSSQPPL